MDDSEEDNKSFKGEIIDGKKGEDIKIEINKLSSQRIKNVAEYATDKKIVEDSGAALVVDAMSFNEEESDEEENEKYIQNKIDFQNIDVESSHYDQCSDEIMSEVTGNMT